MSLNHYPLDIYISIKIKFVRPIYISYGVYFYRLQKVENRIYSVQQSLYLGTLRNTLVVHRNNNSRIYLYTSSAYTNERCYSGKIIIHKCLLVKYVMTYCIVFYLAFYS